jgi:hypothetical protein
MPALNGTKFFTGEKSPVTSDKHSVFNDLARQGLGKGSGKANKERTLP